MGRPGVGFIWAALLGGAHHSLTSLACGLLPSHTSLSLTCEFTGWPGGGRREQQLRAHSARNKLEWVRACTAQADQAGRGKVGAPRASKSAGSRPDCRRTAHTLALPAHLLPVTHLCIGSCRERRTIAESADQKPVSKSPMQPSLSRLDMLVIVEEMREHCETL